jgi:hypothetical protein
MKVLDITATAMSHGLGERCGELGD